MMNFKLKKRALIGAFFNLKFIIFFSVNCLSKGLNLLLVSITISALAFYGGVAAKYR
jgi:hypothetical protein